MDFFSEITQMLPSIDTIDYRAQNKKLFLQSGRTCVVIDDDPTGNQTVHGVPLLTDWDINTLVVEFQKQTPVFFLLTNSRSLTATETQKIYKEITQNIIEASKIASRKYTIISRSDSTLRGHFTIETDTIKEIENNSNSITVFIPVMFEGGRVTVNNTHYIKDGEELLAVGDSPFAKDHTFGYTKSNLKEWIQEKTDKRVLASSVISFSIEQIRSLSVAQLKQQIIEIPVGRYVIANALNYSDLDKFSNALLLATDQGKKILYRSSSSFVPSYIGLPSKELLDVNQIVTSRTQNGGITIVGSYVSKSSLQLNYLLKNVKNSISIEIQIDKILSIEKEDYLLKIMQLINKTIISGKNVIVYTSRKIITGNTEEETIQIASKISETLISIVQKIENQPKYIVAKGGITSHDIATKGLNMKRSVVIGQILPGVPVWKMGEETRFPNIGYIVFPGNVGNEKSLLQLTQKLAEI